MTTTTPSIYIHRAHSECANPDLYRDTFNRVLGADCVRGVDLVKKMDKNNIPFIRAFIHFKFWPRSEVADRMYNDLMTEKRCEITYNHETNWFWRFCRSKLPERDPSKKRRKSRYGEKAKDTTSNDVDANPPIPVLHRTVAQGANDPTGYVETSQRKQSNKPAWMAQSADGDSPNAVTVSDFIDFNADGAVSDDGEEFEEYDIPDDEAKATA